MVRASTFVFGGIPATKSNPRKRHCEGHQPVSNRISANIATKGDLDLKNTFVFLLLFVELDVVKFCKKIEYNKD